MLLTEIKPYKKNAKKHPNDQIEKIAKSIKAFGFNQPIVIDKEGIIIVGHGRYEAAKKLGLKNVPCRIVDLSPDKAKAYRLADNKLNESEWDLKLVVEDLKKLDIKDLELTGFDMTLLDNIDSIVEDHAGEWDGMPQFEQDNQRPYRQIIVSFLNENDVKDFAELINQSLTNKTRSVWFPKQEIDSVKNIRY